MKKYKQYLFLKKTLTQCFRLLGRRDVFVIKATIAFQIFLGILDLIGVALIGILGSLAVRGVSSLEPGNRVSKILDFLGISDFTFQQQIAFLAVASTGVLVCRTLISIYVTRKTLIFLAGKSAQISGNLISKILFQPLTKVRSRSIQDSLYKTTRGVESITLGIIGNLVSLSSDFAMLLILSLGLFVVDFKVALGTIVVFASVSLILFRLLHQKARQLGELENDLSIRSNEKIVEALQAYRELTVSNRRGYYATVIKKSRADLGNVLGQIAFLPSISKYALEITVIVGTLLVSAVQFIAQDASRAVATLSVFMAAATRIAPATIRLQQGLISMRQSFAIASPTLAVINELRDFNIPNEDQVMVDFSHEGFVGEISVRNLTLRYAENSKPALTNVSFDIPSPSFTAIVGISGAGKTSLADVILGVIEESGGSVLVSGMAPLDAIARWPGAISYVPQNVFVANGSILENVALGYPPESVSEARVWECVKLAQLEHIVREYQDKLSTQLGEGGSRLSGGQRQRLGIARALYSNPRVIVLDEATSSLDGKTEFEIANALSALSGTVTLIVIAHRLSTVRKADQVIYLNKGSIEALGTFDQIRSQVPDFDEQAKLMGL